MSGDRTKKEKTTALLVVFILFILVGSLFGYISFVNKQDTLRLQSKASSRKLEVLAREHISQLEVSNFDQKDISAKAFLTLAITSGGFKKVLAQNNADEPLPIASLTKLMTAIIVREKINLRNEVVATEQYVGGYGSAKVLEVDKTYNVLELLKDILISSDNDSARLLSSMIGESNFIDLMNKKAKDLGLKSTSFINVTGLDPISEEGTTNVSTANDLAMIIDYINENHPDIFQITRDAQYNFCDVDQSCYTIVSTNKLLDNPKFNFEIIGGKTGQTYLAGKNLALILKPFDGIFLINIVLGSKDHFADTKTIVNHLTINN